MFSNFYMISFTQQNSSCISNSTMKHPQKSDWKSKLLWFSYGYRECMVVTMLEVYLDLSMNCGRFQPPIGHALDHKSTQTWWLTNASFVDFVLGLPGDHGTPNVHNCWFILFIMCEDLYELKFIEIAFDWGPGHIWLHTTLEGPWPHSMISEVCWDGLWTLSFGPSQVHGNGIWLMCEVALKLVTNEHIINLTARLF